VDLSIEETVSVFSTSWYKVFLSFPFRLPNSPFKRLGPLQSKSQRKSLQFVVFPRGAFVFRVRPCYAFLWHSLSKRILSSFRGVIGFHFQLITNVCSTGMVRCMYCPYASNGDRDFGNYQNPWSWETTSLFVGAL
jgi:hypothetical protein